MNEEEMRELLRRRPEMVEHIEYMKGDWRRAGYWRRKPITYFKPHVNQLKVRLAVSKAAYGSFGEKGFKKVDGKLLPVVAVNVKKRVEGKRFAPPRIEKIFKEMERAFKEMAEVIERRKVAVTA